MKRLPLQGRTLALLAVIVPLLALFIYVGLRSGPLAPVSVTVVTVESRSVAPAADRPCPVRRGEPTTPADGGGHATAGRRRD